MEPQAEPGFTPLPRNLAFRVALLVAVAIVVAVVFVAYALFARGVFQDTQRLVLVADHAEGVSVGMDLSFAGFAIGRVRRISLGEDGKARIEFDVPREQARWLRTTSVFTLEVPLVGGARIRAFSGNLKDPPLPDGAERPVLVGDTSAEVPRLVATLRSITENVEAMTDRGSNLEASLASLRRVTERMAGRQGVLGAALGEEDNAKKVLAAIDRANALLGALGAVAQRLDGVVERADRRVLGAGGVLEETQQAVAQARAILGEVRERLKTADAILAEAQAAAANAKAATANAATASANVARATTDLAALRAEVEASLRKIGQLIDEINRKWPFERETEIRLP
jgi:phospholipid/cholesterol/gamma-HCH transport system substrate-binding protein